MAGQEIALLFNRIYNETNRSVLAYITAKCSSVSDIGDIFQETYLELYRLLLKRGDGYIQNPQALVIRLAKQKVYRHYTLTQRLHQLLPLEGKDEKRPLTIPEEAGPSLEDQICDQALVDQICRTGPQTPGGTKDLYPPLWPGDDPFGDGSAAVGGGVVCEEQAVPYNQGAAGALYRKGW